MAIVAIRKTIPPTPDSASGICECATVLSDDNLLRGAIGIADDIYAYLQVVEFLAVERINLILSEGKTLTCSGDAGDVSVDCHVVVGHPVGNILPCWFVPSAVSFNFHDVSVSLCDFFDAICLFLAFASTASTMASPPCKH